MPGFQFIGNLLDIAVPLPCAVTSSARLERATAKQITGIRSHLRALGPDGARAGEVYESDVKRIDIASGYSLHLEPLKREEWRYYVFSYAGNTNENRILMHAAEIASPSLWSSYFQPTDKSYGRGKFDGAISSPYIAEPFYRHSFMQSKIVRVDEAYIQQLKDTLSDLLVFDFGAFPEVDRALQILYDSRLVRSLKSDARILMLFAILEMLLTHQPKLETDDSITHQITTKLEFIGTRMRAPFEYKLFAGEAAPDKVWKALYAYRSAMAHGREAEIRMSGHRVPKNSEAAFDFLEDAVKRVIRHAIQDPELYRDLRPI